MNYVAFDLGAGSGKFFSGSIKGGKLSLKPLYSFPNGVVNLAGGLYWDFPRIYSEVCEGLRAAERISSVDSFGIDGYNNDFALIDARGDLLSPVRAYRDPRGITMREEIFRIMPPRELYMRSGNQIAPFNTLMHLAAMKLLGQGWMLDNADRLLMLPDLLAYYITGEAAIEYTLAAETELLELGEKRWIDEIFSAFGIPRRIFPKLVTPGNILGRSTASFNSRLGIRGFDFVNVCEHDTASAFIASPLGRDAIFISSGTWALVGVETERPVINEFTYRYNIANEGGMDGHHRIIKNVMGSWIIQELRREYALEGTDYSFEQIQTMALKAAPFAFPIDPDIDEFFLPGEMRGKIREASARENGKSPETPEAFFRCVYEALAMKYRYSAELLEKASNRGYGAINILGGGCQDALANSFTASACNRKVVAGPVSASSIGNIALQAIAHGEISGVNEAREIVSRSFELKEFYPESPEEWNRHYPRYREIFEKNLEK